jgi:hypothetical protein
METVSAPRDLPIQVKFACPACGRKYASRPELAGKKIRCIRCKQGVRVPGVETSDETPRPMEKFEQATPPPKVITPPATVAPVVRRRGLYRSPSPGGTGSLPPQTGHLHGAPRHPEAPEREPTISKQPRSEAGTTLEELAAIQGAKRPRRSELVLAPRSELLEQVRLKDAEKKAEEEVRESNRSKKKQVANKPKKRKPTGFFDPKETMKLVAGVTLVVGVLAFLAWGYPEFRFPLGGALSVIGFIVYLLGSVSIRQLVKEEGIVKVLIYRFFPPYQWWFVVSRWQDTRDFFAFFAAGMVIMAIGGGIIKTSATGKKAEASERAYQQAIKAGSGASAAPTMPPLIRPAAGR